MLKLLTRLLNWLAKAIAVYCAGVLVLAFWPVSGIVVLGIVWWIKRNHRSTPTDLGSARWADESDLGSAGLLDATSGLILGRLPLSRRSMRGLRQPKGPLVRLPQAVHTV